MREQLAQSCVYFTITVMKKDEKGQRRQMRG